MIWYLASAPFWVSGLVFAYNAYAWVTKIDYAKKSSSIGYALFSVAFCMIFWGIAVALIA